MLRIISQFNLTAGSVLSWIFCFEIIELSLKAMFICFIKYTILGTWPSHSISLCHIFQRGPWKESTQRDKWLQQR